MEVEHVVALDDTAVHSRQQLSSAAPDGKTLWVESGLLRLYQQTTSQNGAAASQKETYQFLVGPVLAGGGRAIATMSVVAMTLVDKSAFTLSDVEVDIDDETGRAQLQFQLATGIEAMPGTSGYRAIAVLDVGYQVTILGTAAA
jgi:hypothetical protein